MVNSKREENNISEDRERFLNIPNMLTLLRLGLTFVFIYMLFSNFYKNYLAIIFVIAALTDWLDGFLARKLHQRTKIGGRMDQVVDRIFTVSIVIALLIHSIGHDLFGQTLVLILLICSREIISTPGVIIAIIRERDVYRVKFIGKLTTFVQAFALGAIILQFPYTLYLAIATCAIGILAGLDYLRYSLKR